MYMFSCISLSRQQLCTCTMLTAHFSAVVMGRRERRRDEFVPSGRMGMSRGRKAWLQPFQHPVFLWFGKFWPSDMCTCTAWDESHHHYRGLVISRRGVASVWGTNSAAGCCLQPTDVWLSRGFVLLHCRERWACLCTATCFSCLQRWFLAFKSLTADVLLCLAWCLIPRAAPDSISLAEQQGEVTQSFPSDTPVT